MTLAFILASMDMQLLLAHVGQFIEPSEEEIAFLKSILIARPVKQGEVIVEGGDPARYLAFVNKGFTVTYYADQEGLHHVIRFAAPGWWSGDIYSLNTH